MSRTVSEPLGRNAVALLLACTVAVIAANAAGYAYILIDNVLLRVFLAVSKPGSSIDESVIRAGARGLFVIKLLSWSLRFGAIVAIIYGVFGKLISRKVAVLFIIVVVANIVFGPY